MNSKSNESPRGETSPRQDQVKVLPASAGTPNQTPTQSVPTSRFTLRELLDRSLGDTGPAATPPAGSLSRESMSLAGLIDRTEGRNMTPRDMLLIEESLKMECGLLQRPGDRLLDARVRHGQIYCAILGEHQSATHNSGCLRLIVASIDLDDKTVWETVIRLPLSAPDSRGLFCLAGEALDDCIAPTVKWLSRYHDLTQKGHARTLQGLFKAGATHQR